MVALCFGTLVLGGAAAAIVPFLPFLAAVILAAFLGAILAAAHGEVGLPLLIDSIVLIACAQVGYAIGLAGLSLATSWTSPKTMIDRRNGSSSDVMGSIGADKK